MAQSTISARLDLQDKIAFDQFCDAVGLSASTAINLFVKTVIREKRIPFDITLQTDPFYNEENHAYILKSVQELRNGKGTKHELIEENDDE